MDLDELKQILEIVREHELTEFELEQEGLKLRVKKQAAAPPSPVFAAAGVAAAPPEARPPGPAAVAHAPQAEPAEAGELELAVVKSPIVGTFYRAPEPGAPPFTEVGAAVRKGQVLCIIEAMKLMNEIESEYDGEVVRIYVDNGQPVQYGERLFAIKAR
jgi:acetyl-CoA carboxylase biotin carboxyl carrier protein